mgnify:CR=1 FL=1
MATNPSSWPASSLGHHYNDSLKQTRVLTVGHTKYQIQQKAAIGQKRTPAIK